MISLESCLLDSETLRKEFERRSTGQHQGLRLAGAKKSTIMMHLNGLMISLLEVGAQPGQAGEEHERVVRLKLVIDPFVRQPHSHLVGLLDRFSGATMVAGTM